MLIQVDKLNGEFKFTEYQKPNEEDMAYRLAETEAENTNLKQELYELRLELRKANEELEVCKVDLEKKGGN